MQVQSFDNINNLLIDDLKEVIGKDSKVSIAAAYFSIYAFSELKKQLSSIEEMRFIFSSPTFIADRQAKELREFYIPRLNRERSLYGTEFEVKLRNELSQKAIAKECADWIRKKVTFKSNITDETVNGFIHVENKPNSFSYNPINGFTTGDLGCEKGENLVTAILKLPTPHSDIFLQNFDKIWNDKAKLHDVTENVIENITTAYKENSPELIYFITLYNVFSEFLEDISEDNLPNEATGFKESKVWNMLYNFQQDAVLAIINKLEKYNGCILADSVGLGKTFTALATIKYYENKNKTVLVLCPKKLANNWNTYKGNYKNNPILEDRLRYDVLYHTDLSRKYGLSNGLDLEYINWGNYDLVVIDESHNFRNGGHNQLEEGRKESRYDKLMHKIMRAGVKTKVLMLSATPVNTKFSDLKNQLQLAYEGDVRQIDKQLNTKSSLDKIFKRAQTAFNVWSKLSYEERTSSRLLEMLDLDFFEVLDSVTIARSRAHIEKYYDTKDIGKFPERLKPISLRPDLTDLADAISYSTIFAELMKLNLAVYTPTAFILQSKIEKYEELWGDNKVNIGITQANREYGIKNLTAINLMKRMESSVYSFHLTLSRISLLIDGTINKINSFIDTNDGMIEANDILTPSANTLDEYDDDDQNIDELFSIGRKIKLNIADMDYISWRTKLEEDYNQLKSLQEMIERIDNTHDSKLQELYKLLENKIKNPINKYNKKVIIFTAFADTAKYLYDNVSIYMKDNLKLNTAMITGSVEGKSTVAKLRTDLNTVLSCFSPISKNKSGLDLLPDDEIDILIATDCISEGQNLQDCDYLINYDIHWNPTRIIQRFGRIDRIGSRNEYIQLVNFWPNISLDEYINLKSKVESRMKIVDMTATGDENIISEEEKVELLYRKKQLERLQEEVVDIEEMASGVSIMDLGLNEFRLDLLEYIRKHPELEIAPHGMHSIVWGDKEAGSPSGVIYILKNMTKSINTDNKNRLHPFYMLYISENGTVVYDHLSPKEILNKIRNLCKGKEEPIPELYKEFNAKTKDGKDMKELSMLLEKSINSIIDVKEKSTIESFLDGDTISFANSKIKGLDDFELITFLIVKSR